MFLSGPNRTRQRTHAVIFAVVAAGCVLTGCGKKEEVAAPAPATPAAVPVNPAGTSAVGVSPSNTISQKEQAEMAAEKTAK